MYSFNYERPISQSQAQSLLQAGGQALAGGQTLLASMKQRLLAPEQLVDLAGLPELRGVCMDADTLVIGAMTTHHDVAHNDLVRQHLPGLAALANGIGDRQVRAMGTLGGSLELKFVPASADMKQGDLLTTSGIDGVYPAGLHVARISNVERRVEISFARIHAKPLAEMKGRHVLVLQPTGTQLPVKGKSS